MDNHFHLLVRVPKKDERERIDDAELLRRFRLLYDEGLSEYMPISAEELEEVLASDGEAAGEWRNLLRSRMHDLPMFMKILKQRFTQWYNGSHKTFGTFWARRYSNLLLEPSNDVLRQLATFIDLSPVRMGLVKRPADYIWCGFSEAKRGDVGLREAQAQLMIKPSQFKTSKRKTGRSPRDQAFDELEQLLFAGGQAPGDDSLKMKVFRGIVTYDLFGDPALTAAARRNPMGIALELTKLLAGGLAYGSIAFVEANAGWIQNLLKRKDKVD